MKTVYKLKMEIFGLQAILKNNYLGLILDKHLSYVYCTDTLADACSRALRVIRSKFKYCKDIVYSTISKLYYPGICSATEYDYDI